LKGNYSNNGRGSIGANSNVDGRNGNKNNGRGSSGNSRNDGRGSIDSKNMYTAPNLTQNAVWQNFQKSPLIASGQPEKERRRGSPTGTSMGSDNIGGRSGSNNNNNLRTTNRSSSDRSQSQSPKRGSGRKSSMELEKCIPGTAKNGSHSSPCEGNQCLKSRPPSPSLQKDFHEHMKKYQQAVNEAREIKKRLSEASSESRRRSSNPASCMLDNHALSHSNNSHREGKCVLCETKKVSNTPEPESPGHYLNLLHCLEKEFEATLKRYRNAIDEALHASEGDAVKKQSAAAADDHINIENQRKSPK